jgi:hypothetical protein
LQHAKQSSFFLTKSVLSPFLPSRNNGMVRTVRASFLINFYHSIALNWFIQWTKRTEWQESWEMGH